MLLLVMTCLLRGPASFEAKSQRTGEVVESTFNMTALLHHIADICTYIDDYHIAVFLWYM